MRPRKFAAGIGGLLEHLEGGLLARVKAFPTPFCGLMVTTGLQN